MLLLTLIWSGKKSGVPEIRIQFREIFH